MNEGSCVGSLRLAQGTTWEFLESGSFIATMKQHCLGMRRWWGYGQCYVIKNLSFIQYSVIIVVPPLLWV